MCNKILKRYTMEFNINEIFQIAVHIEKSGHNFYKEAAKKLPDFADFFTYLANEEINHEFLFKKMEDDSVAEDFLKSIWNPDDIISQYFDSLTESTIFKTEKEISEIFKNYNNITEVIDWAIKREHESVLFFTGLKEGLSSSEEQKIVDQIISEEIGHVHKLMVKKSEYI